MPAGQLDSVIRQLRGACLPGGAGPGDGELLERFVSQRDEGAFGLLVRRHGPMVLGVCRRVLRNEADAEDAFQATFVVLIRKAHSVVPRSGVGNWLYGVAHKTALKARAMSSRRRVKERQAGAAPPRKTADGTWAPLLDALDDELSALPEKYRTPIVLCDLEGLSYRGAAARLGCPQGTLSGRLTRGRALLARRLARRGLSIPAGALATLLARDAAALPPPLLAATLRTGYAFAADRTLRAGAVSAKVASLAEGALKMMLLSKLKSAAVGPLLVALVVAAGWACAARVSAQATGRGEAPAPHNEESPPASIPKRRAEVSRARPSEAEFVFLAADGGRAVSLVVAGTSAPVLKLPVTDDVRVLAGGRPVGVKGLRPGTRVLIRMGPANRAIQEIRAAGEEWSVPVLQNAKALQKIEPPSEAEVLRALPPGTPPVPGAFEVSRTDIEVVTERQADQADPPRFFPLVGRAQLHHCPWKCTVYYREVIETTYPFPFRLSRPRVEVIYIDKNYLVSVN
jgi:RNA polymerase sigma factor (sigma-70 family)